MVPLFTHVASEAVLCGSGNALPLTVPVHPPLTTAAHSPIRMRMACTHICTPMYAYSYIYVPLSVLPTSSLSCPPFSSVAVANSGHTGSFLSLSKCGSSQSIGLWNGRVGND